MSQAKQARGWTRHVPTLVGIILLIGAVYVVQREFRHLKWRDIQTALTTIPSWALFVSFVWTVLSYYILTFYDRLGTIYAGHKVAYGRVCFAAFCAYTLSHNLGLAAVSGAAVRYRLYSNWGLSNLQIGKLVAFCSFTFGLGGLVLGGAVLFHLPADRVPLFGPYLPQEAIWALAAGMWLVVASYISLAKILPPFRLLGNVIELPGWRMAVTQVFLATIDVVVTAMIFYALLPASVEVDWVVFLAVYLIAYTGGLAANLPGGIGVFDTAMLLGLQPYVEAPAIIAAIVVFRLYYYLIPLFIAGPLFSGNEVLQRLRRLWHRPRES
jgi:uncharacterized membrane protein YbhN (UPF0104 family)